MPEHGTGRGDLEALDARLVGRRVLAGEDPSGVELLHGVAGQRPGEEAVRHALGEPAVEEERLPGREDEPAQEPVAGGAARLGVRAAAQDGASEVGVPALDAEALGSEEVGEAAHGEGLGGGPRQGRVAPAHHDREAIPARVSGAQLVPVTGRRGHAPALTDQGRRVRALRDREGEPLDGDRVAVLEPRHADVALGDGEPTGQLANHVPGGATALLYLKVEVRPLSAGDVGGDLVDPEVLRRRLQGAAGAGDLRGDEGQRRHPAHGAATADSTSSSRRFTDCEMASSASRGSRSPAWNR